MGVWRNELQKMVNKTLDKIKRMNKKLGKQGEKIN